LKPGILIQRHLHGDCTSRALQSSEMAVDWQEYAVPQRYAAVHCTR